MRTRRADLFDDVMPFVVVAEEGSFTKAARQLRVTTSAVSKAVSRLEASVGVRLVERSARTFRLTDEGRAFFASAQGAALTLDAARAAVAANQGRVHGTLKISVPLALGELVITPALPRLLARHAALQVDASFTDEYVDLERGAFDAVVRVGQPTASTLRRHALPPIDLVTVGAPSYLARAHPTSVDALGQHACLPFVLPTGKPQPWVFRGGTRLVTGPVTANSPAALVQLALAGVGLAQVHHYAVASELAEGRLVEVLRGQRPPPLPLNVLFPPSRAKSAKVRAFIAAMDELFQRSRTLA